MWIQVLAVVGREESMISPRCGYKEFDQRALESGAAIAWASTKLEDVGWDEFLQKTPLGQFQQSSIWARAKGIEGWSPLRITLTLDGEVVAGFQILRRSSWWGSVGYISKGPVLLLQDPGIANYVAELLRKVCRSEGLRALIVQPPDCCSQMAATVTSGGFIREVLAGVNDATWIIDLKDGFEAVEQRMNKETRKKAKQAASRGVCVREGGRADLGTFFELMLSTCRRQGVAPSPPDLRTLLALWDAALPAGCIRLFLSEYDGKPLTGQICILFGQTVTLWKTGWNSTEARRHPNDLTIYEVLKWASLNNYQSCDFSALDRGIATAMLKGEELSPEQAGSRYMFPIRFGGNPKLLPGSQVYFANAISRLVYRAIFHNKIRQAEENHTSSARFQHPKTEGDGCAGEELSRVNGRGVEACNK
jgi:hypothetical protein